MTHNPIQDFWQQKKFAVVGVSARQKKFGFTLYQEMKKRNYEVYAVNKNGGTLKDGALYSGLRAIPQTVDGVLIVVPPAETEKVVQQCDELNIRKVWMQQGSESKRAIQFCQEHDIDVVHHECALMYLEPRHFPHSMHYWFANIFRRK